MAQRQRLHDRDIIDSLAFSEDAEVDPFDEADELPQWSTSLAELQTEDDFNEAYKRLANLPNPPDIITPQYARLISKLVSRLGDHSEGFAAYVSERAVSS